MILGEQVQRVIAVQNSCGIKMLKMQSNVQQKQNGIGQAWKCHVTAPNHTR